MESLNVITFNTLYYKGNTKIVIVSKNFILFYSVYTKYYVLVGKCVLICPLGHIDFLLFLCFEFYMILVLFFTINILMDIDKGYFTNPYFMSMETPVGT